MLAGRHAAWLQGWRAIRRGVETPATTGTAAAATAPLVYSGEVSSGAAFAPGGEWTKLDTEREHQVYISESRRGVLVARHEAAWTLEAQRDAIREIRQSVLARPTRHLHCSSRDGVHNTLMVLRFLHDFEGRVAQVQCGSSGGSEEDDGASPDKWSSLELFCRPWVVSQGGGPTLLRMEEHVPPSLRALCAVCSPWGLPFGSLLAWVTLQSPKAFCRLHLRRIAGPGLAPWHVRADATYRVELGDADAEAALKEVVASPMRICDIVKGDPPALLRP
mmetsp:Transcript_80870/g.205523  ORF Transcript_80870/g.205523 Transcript_80870/m.205523 type:complete len:276 (+) Transcript_80870:100-927(+)|eukprot:CAMPEP_0183390236 /NCGR_PEP_ID=MMETSP0370-20130417/5534_1 /TAXON_ID=268820 /ORGANISM="Peridinium aciculiferum, Strain PAER-2" /LENGTH=275 /DNA_ID=CAMNT_0025569689 /DNA_START=99 /DNA_END=926 /DNA_ORIENTATION=+